jgi:hypothetical protein
MHDNAKLNAVQGLSQKCSVRAVVFDYGNVLCFEQTLERMKGMALVCGIPHERFSGLYWKPWSQSSRRYFFGGRNESVSVGRSSN